jgi:hypothetical protein
MTSGVRDNDMRDQVVALRNQGLSMGEIADKLRSTKNSVTGYCNRARRAGIDVKHTRAPKNFQRERAAQPQEIGPTRSQSREVLKTLPGAAAAESPLRSAPPPPMNKACRFIAGEKGKDFLLYGDPGVFCGEMVRDGSAYCPNHHRRTHTRPYTKEGGPFAHTGAGAAGTR